VLSTQYDSGVKPIMYYCRPNGSAVYTRCNQSPKHLGNTGTIRNNPLVTQALYPLFYINDTAVNVICRYQNQTGEFNNRIAATWKDHKPYRTAYWGIPVWMPELLRAWCFAGKKAWKICSLKWQVQSAACANPAGSFPENTGKKRVCGKPV